jgi:hypothetical protein
MTIPVNKNSVVCREDYQAFPPRSFPAQTPL